MNHPKKKGSKLGKSKNAHKLAQDIEDATARLIKTGEDIAQEFPEIREEMLAACKDCRSAGMACVICCLLEKLAMKILFTFIKTDNIIITHLYLQYLL